MNEIYELDPHDLAKQPRLLLSRSENLQYDIDYKKGCYYLLINDMGKNFRLIKTQNVSDKSTYIELIAHDRAKYIRYFALYENHLAVSINQNGQYNIILFA